MMHSLNFINQNRTATSTQLLMKTIDAFILYTRPEQAIKTVDQLKKSECVRNIYLLTPQKEMQPIDGCKIIEIDSMQSSETIQKIGATSTADFILIYQKSTVLHSYFALERMTKLQMKQVQQWSIQIIMQLQMAKEESPRHRLSIVVGDDFTFGSLLLYNSNIFKESAERLENTTTSLQECTIYD